jgi:hypothetical protein
MAICPDCEFDEIDTTDHEEGDELSCPECGKTLVMSGPDQLDVADDDDLDDDDDDEDDEDEEKEGEEDLEEGLLEDDEEVDEEDDD